MSNATTNHSTGHYAKKYALSAWYLSSVNFAMLTVKTACDRLLDLGLSVTATKLIIFTLQLNEPP